MTKEELEKITVEFMNKYNHIEYARIESVMGKELLAYAELFENRISELEKENAELKKELKTAYRKGMRHMAKALKDYDRTDGVWTDYFEHTVDKVLQREQLEFEEYGTLADQLTKTKDLIKNIIRVTWGEGWNYSLDWKVKAEQFLKDNEVKNALS